MMELVPAPVACAYGASVLRKQIDAMRQEFEGVRFWGNDIEYIHRLRVATRRLRTMLTIFGGCYEKKHIVDWQKQIRSLTRSLGAARDADVQLGLLNTFLADLPERKLRPGVQRIILRLSQRRERLQKGVVRALDELERQGTLEKIETQISRYFYQQEGVPHYTLDLRYLARDAISLRVVELLQHQDCVEHPEQVSELHMMRIAAKHLRYTLETLDPIFERRLQPFIKSTRNAQDLLGIIHDCDMWAIWIPRFMEKERLRIVKFYGHLRPVGTIRSGVEYFSQDRERERDCMFRKFQKQWTAWQEKRLWERLLNIVSIGDEDESEPAAESPVQVERDAAN